MENNQITEKQFPITNRWIIKSSSGTMIVWVGLMFFLILRNASKPSTQEGLYFDIALFIIISIIGTIFLIIRRSNFHFSIDQQNININQGIFNKSQIHIPFSSIQDVILKQDLLDKILGIYLLVIENFAGSGVGGDSRAESIGVIGNQISIPGLTKEHAETLKSHILEKVKQNPSSLTSRV